MWNAFILAFALTAAIGDIWWRKIPRTLTTAGFLIGLAFHYFHGGPGGLLQSFATGILGFVIGVAFFQLGAIGGGDVKLIAALGAMLGNVGTWFSAMEAAIFAAAAMAVIQMIRHRVVRQTFRNIGHIMKGWFVFGIKAHPVVNVKNPVMVRSPFGVAAAVGTFFAVYWR